MFKSNDCHNNTKNVFHSVVKYEKEKIHLCLRNDYPIMTEESISHVPEKGNQGLNKLI